MNPMAPAQCPHCGSYLTARERGPWDWIWQVAAAGLFLMRLVLTFARLGEDRGEPGVYRCGRCGRSFTVFL